MGSDIISCRENLILHRIGLNNRDWCASIFWQPGQIWKKPNLMDDNTSLGGKNMLSAYNWSEEDIDKMSKNPLSFLGLRRAGHDSDDEAEEVQSSPRTSKGGLELNKRGIPARKRKLNSLIYGIDDLVSIPIKSPKKKGQVAPKTPTKTAEIENESDREDFNEALNEFLPSPTKAIKTKWVLS